MEKLIISQSRRMMLMETLNGYEARQKHFFTFYTMEDDIFKKTHELELGINWSAIGTVTAERTLEFADSLRKAAWFCVAVNALRIEWSYGDHEDIDDDKGRREEKMLLEASAKDDYPLILAWIKSVCRKDG